MEILPDGRVSIGGAVTLSDLQSWLKGRSKLLDQAIDSIASAQIREMATVAGNLLQAKRCWFFRNGFGCYKRLGGMAPCYAILGDHRFYHAAMDGHRCQATTPSDLATALMALDGHVVLVSPQGERRLPMAEFLTGPGETALAADEILRAIELPASALERHGCFLKLRLWEGDFAIVSVALSAQNLAGGWQSPRLAFGGLAPVPWRAIATEKFLAGSPKDVAALRRKLDRELDARAHPLARNGWKLDAAAGLAEQAFETMQNHGEAA